MNTHLIELCKRTATGIVLLISVGGAYLHSSTLFIAVLGALLGIVLCTEWPQLIDLTKPSRWLVTILYPVLPFAALISLTYRFYDTDFYLPLLPFLLAWSADTGGYIVGKLIGNHKMCPSISPGKSWEGFTGSVLSVLAMCWYILPKTVLFRGATCLNSVVALSQLALCISSISFAGGFFLSLLKRQQGLKDAGSLLPGHGGVLDRFDGVLFVALLILTLVTRQTSRPQPYQKPDLQALRQELQVHVAGLIR